MIWDRTKMYFWVIVAFVLIAFLLLSLLAGQWNPFAWHWLLRIVGAMIILMALITFVVWVVDDVRKERQ